MLSRNVQHILVLEKSRQERQKSYMGVNDREFHNIITT